MFLREWVLVNNENKNMLMCDDEIKMTSQYTGSQKQKKRKTIKHNTKYESTNDEING